MRKVLLSDVAHFATEKASNGQVNKGNFISTDNMLPNLGGI